MKSIKLTFNLKQKLMITILVACAIPFSFGAAYLNTFFEKWYYSFNQENTYQMLSQIDDYLQLALDKQMVELTEEIASSSQILKGNETIRTYMSIETEQASAISSEEEGVADYFGNMKKTHQDILYVFLGLEDGSYMEYPEFKPVQNYDPRVRPWFINAINVDGTLMSEPYVSKVTNEKVISFTKRIILENGQKGVVGIAVSIEALTNKIEQIKIDEQGYVIVLDKYDKVIVSPKNHSWLLQSPDQIGEQALLNVIGNKSYVLDTLDGEKKIMFSYNKADDFYTIIAVLDPKIYQSNIQKVSFILVGIFVLTFVLLMYVVNYVANRFTEPIISIAKSLEKVKEDDIDIAIDEEISQYNQYKDEIGTISRAVHVLIKNINKNFDLLLKKNEEITLSNTKLAASEEVLICQLEEIEEKKLFIEHLAMHDSLTDIPNRRYFYEFLNNSILKGEKGAVILMDIDNFKSVNDILGHKTGDDLLILVAEHFKQIIDEDSIISRFGGDEFFVLKRGIDKPQMRDYLEKLRERFDDPFVIAEHKLDIKLSIGVSFYPEDSCDVNQLLMNADLAMYSVKNNNKNNYAFYESKLQDSVVEKIRIENIIKEALDNDGFKIVCQPIVSVSTGEINSFEALLRLKNYPIPPAKFIMVAEETGSIISIGRKVVDLVLAQLKEWKDSHVEIKPVSINYSAKQLFDLEFYDYLVLKLAEYDIESRYIKIEMTENVFFEKRENTFSFLNKLRQLGIKVMIDDFGTGYASLGYLTAFPIDVVKLDQSINSRYLNHDSLDIIKNIIALVHSFDLEVVAEGIETMEQFDLMRSQGCDYIQGYVFSRPIEVQDVIPIIDTKYF